MWQCRWSPTLGALESTHQEVWGTGDYVNDTDPTCFFGVYGLPDFYTLWRHKGERHVLWAGSDITHLKNGYFLDDGKIRLHPKALGKWLNKYCTNWVENEVEAKALKKLGVKAKVTPSYLGNTNLPISFKPGNKLYTSVSGDNFELYGWNLIPALALVHSDIEFHLYGNTVPYGEILPNIIDHGRVPIEQMIAETQDMQGALRLTEFDGFSEILARSILWGQYPVSLIKYPHMLAVNEIGEITKKTEANLEGVVHYRKTLNKYPWKS
jgi:hypothetical protein